MEFGTSVLYKAGAKVEGGVMEPRWKRGVWLGKGFGTDEDLVGTSPGTVGRSVSVKVDPDGPWNREFFDAIG